MNYLLFWSICASYFAGWITNCILLFTNERIAKGWGEKILLLGLFLQFIYIILDLITSGTFPLDSLSGLFLFLSFFTILIFFVVEFKFPNQIFKIVIPPVSLFFMVLSITISDHAIVAKAFLDKSPGFGNFMLFAHASCSMLGYLLFGVACLTSMFYLYQENKIKKKTLLLSDEKVPSLGFLDKMNYKVIAMGFLFLSVGILLGINMKIISTSGQIQLSLRQLLPVTTWLIYASFLIDRFINGLRGKITSMWSIAGFLAAVTSFLYEVSLLIKQT